MRRFSRARPNIKGEESEGCSIVIWPYIQHKYLIDSIRLRVMQYRLAQWFICIRYIAGLPDKKEIFKSN
jgi:hypothetical protein